METLNIPGASDTTRRPLSTHGMPKPPSAMSPEFPHRFSPLGLPSPSTVSGFTTPRSPGPMSPPMSARSFGTFIDSAPSTPAYSPRMDYDWDDSQIVLLRTMSSSSEPSSPNEPVWDMIQPSKKSKKDIRPFVSMKKERSRFPRETFEQTMLSPPPKKAKASQKTLPVKEMKATASSQEEDQHPHTQRCDHSEVPAQGSPENSTAPFGKLASKMKLMLRRKSTTSEKKKEKKEKDYYGPEEDLHWTEM